MINTISKEDEIIDLIIKEIKKEYELFKYEKLHQSSEDLWSISFKITFFRECLIKFSNNDWWKLKNDSKSRIFLLLKSRYPENYKNLNNIEDIDIKELKLLLLSKPISLISLLWDEKLSEDNDDELNINEIFNYYIYY